MMMVLRMMLFSLWLERLSDSSLRTAIAMARVAEIALDCVDERVQRAAEMLFPYMLARNASGSKEVIEVPVPPLDLQDALATQLANQLASGPGSQTASQTASQTVIN